jgi:hypothetical protein
MTHPDFRLVLLVAAVAPSCADKDDSYDTVCFVGTTLVDTPSGPIRIDQLQPGDHIWSWDVEQGARVERLVHKVLPSKTSELMMIPTQQGWIAGVTANHPFAVVDPRGWVLAAQLRTGDLVVRVQGPDAAPVAVIGQPMVARTAQVAVYDLTVQGPEHNFVADGWLVHNKSCFCLDSDDDGWYTGDPDLDARDCNDSDPTINPGATEVCDDVVDNDCDGLIDGSDPDCGARSPRPVAPGSG